jgi:hypothetical protein
LAITSATVPIALPRARRAAAAGSGASSSDAIVAHSVETSIRSAPRTATTAGPPFGPGSQARPTSVAASASAGNTRAASSFSSMDPPPPAPFA